MGKYPRVGIGVMIQNEKGEVLLGLRRGSHGAGEWCFPGNHLEYGEIIFEADMREVKEESGLAVDQFELISVADEMKYLESDGKHFINIGIKADYQGGDPEICEPDKCLEWRWFDLQHLPEKMLEGSELTIRNYKRGRIYSRNPII